MSVGITKEKVPKPRSGDSDSIRSRDALRNNASGINVADVKIQSFLESQAERIHGPERDGHPPRLAAVDDLMHLFDGEHFRQRIAPSFRSHLVQNPVHNKVQCITKRSTM